MRATACAGRGHRTGRPRDSSITDPDASCIDVLQQVAAIKGAVNGLMNELVEAHLRHHVLAQAEQVNEEELAEFLKLLKRYG